MSINLGKKKKIYIGRGDASVLLSADALVFECLKMSFVLPLCEPQVQLL